jgi:hypothetical protein
MNAETGETLKKCKSCLFCPEFNFNLSVAATSKPEGFGAIRFTPPRNSLVISPWALMWHLTAAPPLRACPRDAVVLREAILKPTAR